MEAPQSLRTLVTSGFHGESGEKALRTCELVTQDKIYAPGITQGGDALERLHEAPAPLVGHIRIIDERMGRIRIPARQVLIEVDLTAQVLTGRRGKRGDPLGDAEDNGGQEQGSQRCRKNAQAGLVAQRLVLQGEVGHEQGDREAHTGQGRQAQDPGQVQAGQTGSRHEAQHQACSHGDAHELAEDEARDDGPHDA